MLTFPKDTAQLSWTRHIKNKMVFYHLSAAQILRIFNKPDRREEGVAPETIAAMQRKKSVGAKQARSEEIWIMYRVNAANTKERVAKSDRPQPLAYGSALRRSRVVMISAWRYPGVTKAGDRPPIPESILEELVRSGDLS